jgi:trimethylamine:corrinoid methyltransferase-like protein
MKLDRTISSIDCKAIDEVARRIWRRAGAAKNVDTALDAELIMELLRKFSREIQMEDEKKFQP